MLPQAAAERSAGHAWAALTVVADASQIAARRVGKKDVGPQCTAAILSGYKGTCPVKGYSLACALLTQNGPLARGQHSVSA
jgi:hypothetical protein